MLGHTKKLPTDTVVLSFTVPSAHKAEAVRQLHNLGYTVQVEQEYYNFREIFTGTDSELGASCLRGARYRENMTQVQLAEKTGISRRHISEMENGKRTIGRQNAKKLATALNIDPRILISVD